VTNECDEWRIDFNSPDVKTTIVIGVIERGLLLLLLE
jgi:hypothetical protein